MCLSIVFVCLYVCVCVVVVSTSFSFFCFVVLFPAAILVGLFIEPTVFWYFFLTCSVVFLYVIYLFVSGIFFNLFVSFFARFCYCCCFFFVSLGDAEK